MFGGLGYFWLVGLVWGVVLLLFFGLFLIFTRYKNIGY